MKAIPLMFHHRLVVADKDKMQKESGEKNANKEKKDNFVERY